MADSVAAVSSSQPNGEGKEAVDTDTVEQDYAAPGNEVNGNEEKFVVASDDDDKVDDMADRSIDGEIAALVVSVATMEHELNCETNAGETVESLADHQCKPFSSSELTFFVTKLSMLWL
jgi:hypothetical protein